MFAAFPDLFCHVLQQCIIVVCAKLSSVEDVNNQTVRTTFQCSVCRVFVFLILRVICARRVDQLQCRIIRCQEWNVSFYINFPYIFIFVECFHDVIGQILNFLNHISVCIIDHRMKAVVVVVKNFCDFICTGLIGRRHQLSAQQRID